jgi:transcriptional regulator with XRE-family HTH domain
VLRLSAEPARDSDESEQRAGLRRTLSGKATARIANRGRPGEGRPRANTTKSRLVEPTREGRIHLGQKAHPPSQNQGPESGFGKRLREARGIQTQADVAKRADIARSAYARYETGGRYPSVPELRRLCEALSVTPEHLIFGETGPGYKPSPSPLTQIASDGDSEKSRISRLVLTGVLLNALPQNEADAFRELIWASASNHLNDQPEVLNAITELCNVLTDSIWPEMNELIDKRFESDADLKEVIESLSENKDGDS